MSSRRCSTSPISLLGKSSLFTSTSIRRIISRHLYNSNILIISPTRQSADRMMSNSPVISSLTSAFSRQAAVFSSHKLQRMKGSSKHLSYSIKQGTLYQEGTSTPMTVTRSSNLSSVAKPQISTLTYSPYIRPALTKQIATTHYNSSSTKYFSFRASSSIVPWSSTTGTCKESKPRNPSSSNASTSCYTSGSRRMSMSTCRIRKRSNISSFLII